MSDNRGQSSGAVSNTELGPCSNSISHSSPAPNKPYGFCGRKAPRKKTIRVTKKNDGVRVEGVGVGWGGRERRREI